MKKIVLALALAAVTPAVLVAQENGNAYNQNTNEVIAPSNPTQQASIVNFGPEGKLLSLADLTLAKIRSHREARAAAKAARAATPEQTEVTDIPNKSNTVYYAYAGREGHMMALENLGQKKSTKPQRVDTTTTTPVTTQRTNVTYNPYVGPEGHRMAIGNAVRDARQDTAAPAYIREADTISNNHQVVLNSRSSEKSVKRSNSSFRKTLREVGSAIGHAIAQQAQYEK